MNAALDPARYAREFPSLQFFAPEAGILELVIANKGRLNAATEAMHRDLAQVWRAIDIDESVRVVVVRGEGANFSSGGDFDMIERMIEDEATLLRVWKEASDLVYNLINCSKPVVSAIRGNAVGAGLAIALLADVSIAADNARILDGHTRLGVAAGDHAVIIWPLLCGLAKARYHLLTNKSLSGAEAERIGLVAVAVPDAEVIDGRSTWRARSRPAAPPPSAGPSMRSTTGCAWPARASTPRWRWNFWASGWRMCARDWRPRAPSARPSSAAIKPNNGMTDTIEMAALEPVLWASRDAARDPAARTTAIDAAPRLCEQRRATGENSTRRACIPRICARSTDLARFPFTTKADLREAYPFGFFAVPREQVARIHASSGTTGKPTVVGYTRNDLATWAEPRGALDSGGRRPRRHESACRVRLWLVHRRAGCALRRRSRGLHGDSDVGRPDRKAGAVDSRFRARHHHGHAELHAGHSR